MSREEIMRKVNDIFRELFEDDNLAIYDATTANDIEEWDSLTHLELITMVEQTFDIQFTLGEINGFANVGAMCDCILKHIRG